MEYIEKHSKTKGGDNLFVLKTDRLNDGELITFIELSDLKEEIDRLYSDEQSRILQESLMGDYECDGCMI